MANHDKLDGLMESDEEVITPSTVDLTIPASNTDTVASQSTAATDIPSHLTGKARQKARMKAQSRRNRQKSREEAGAQQFSHHKIRPNVEKKYVVADNAEETAASIAGSKVARTAYAALDDSIRESMVHTLEELVGPDSKFGFRLLKYKKG